MRALVLCLFFASPAYAGEAEMYLGARFGGLIADSSLTYGQRAARLARKLDAEDPELHRSPIFGGHIGVASRYLDLQLRGRAWWSETDARFRRASEANFRYQRLVVPVHLVPRVRLDGDVVGLRVGGGVGGWWTRVEREGWLGRERSDDVAIGVMVEVALAIMPKGPVSMELSWTRDWADLPETDALIGDAGAAGGHGLNLALQVRL